MSAIFVPALAILGGMFLMAPPSAPKEDRPTNVEDVPNQGPFGSPLSQLNPSGALQIDGKVARDWTDPLGKSIHARLSGIYGATIFLEVEGEEKPMAYPLAGVNREDREYVRSVLRSCGHPELFPGVSNSSDEAANLVLNKDQWQKQLERWTKVILAAKRIPLDAEESRKHIRNIRDPNALEPLTSMIAKQSDDSVRTAYVEAIAGIGGRKATSLLVKLAATDDSGGVRASATWALCSLKDPSEALSEYAKYIPVKQFRDSTLTSLCMTGLIRPLNTYDYPPQVTEKLIDVLIMNQPIDVPYYVWWGYDTGWVPHSDGKAYGVGRRALYHIQRRNMRFFIPVPCEIARKLLVDQSGQDYSYDQAAWRHWYNGQKNMAESRNKANNRETGPTDKK
jgi:hypothetical protein